MTNVTVCRRTWRHGPLTITSEQILSEVNAEPKSCELTEEDLNAVTGGEAKIEPKEGLSLNFAKVQWTCTAN